MKSLLLTKRFLSKKSLIFLGLLLISTLSVAQDITFNVKSYKGGYNISCNGGTDGNIDATIVGGVSPYTYSWSNGATTQDLSNVPAGVYTLTITDASNNIKSKSITLFEPDLLDVVLTPSVYSGGYNISQMGKNDGSITTTVTGGAPPYKYLWSDGSKKATLDKLVAGIYSVTITDQNNCTVSKNITLFQPTPITLSLTSPTYGGYNLSCADSKDGSINLTVSGGMPPYSFNWSNGSFDEDPTNLDAGVYTVQVLDNNKATSTGQITLTKPVKLKVEIATSLYSNGYNISCVSCFNGSITTTVTGGTSSKTYQWSGNGVNGQTTPNVTNLGPGNYSVVVNDANGCKAGNSTFLSEPPASGWDKNGNTINSNNFLGSTNTAPLVIKTDNNERMRVTETGNVGIGTNNPQNKLDVAGNSNITGDLKIGGSFTLGGTQKLSFSPATTTSGSILSFGGGSVSSVPSCFPSFVSGLAKNQFEGLLEIFDNTIIPNSELVMGWDGANGIIDLASNSSSSALYINHYCGKNVYICSGPTAGGGRVGIGTSFPQQKLDVSGGFAHFTFNSQQPPASDNNGGLTLGWNASNGGGEVNLYNVYSADPANTIAFRFVQKTAAGTNPSDVSNLMTIRSNGNVGIGTDLTGSTYDNSYKLAVNGKIRAKDVVVETGWSDFVFDKKFVRMTLLEKETYYLKERHLPNIENGKVIEMNGLQVGKTMNGMMQNIEENTMDLVELYKKMQEIEKVSQELEKENKELKKRIVQLEKK